MSPTVAQLRTLLSPIPAPLELPDVRRASVAVVFDKNLLLVLMQRALREGDPWSGHLSFPGGHREPADESDLAAAVRETQEEIGLALNPEHILGPLSPIQTRGRGVPKRIIVPFVFCVPSVYDLRPNEEVAAVHTLSLTDLLHGTGRSHFTLQWQSQPWTLPQVQFSGGKLWGLTLQILDELLHRIDQRGTGLDRPLETA